MKFINYISSVFIDVTAMCTCDRIKLYNQGDSLKVNDIMVTSAENSHNVSYFCGNDLFEGNIGLANVNE